VIAEIRVDDDILLRWPTMGDAEELFALIDSNRAYMNRWVPWVNGIRTVDDECRWVEGELKERDEGISVPSLIIYQGTLVGSIGATFDPLRKSCDVGYFLAEDIQGRGILTRACRVLLAFLFDNLGMNRVQVRIMPHNVRSIAIPERLGFVYEGIQRQAQLLNGEFHDFSVYSMLASEWATAKSPRGSLA
jgi:ribosomal-protein-serine acetyltransferase